MEQQAVLTRDTQATEQIARRFERLVQLAAADPVLVRRGRFFSCDFKLGVGPLPLVVCIAQGQVTAVARGPFLLRPWTFSLSAEPET